MSPLFPLFTPSSLSLSPPHSLSNSTDNAAHRELLLLSRQALTDSGSIKIPTIREHFTCLSNSQQRSQRPLQTEGGVGDQGGGCKWWGERGGRGRQEMQQADCSMLMLMLRLRQQLVKRLCSCCYTLQIARVQWGSIGSTII